MNSRQIEEISREITYLLEKQYRKAFEDGFKAAQEQSVTPKQLDSWLLSGRFQGHKIYEDIHTQSGLPPTLLQQNNKDKGKEVFANLCKTLDCQELKNFFNNNF